MHVGAVGYNYRHEEGFVMDKPQGSGCYFMLLIKEPALFTINGVETEVKKNSFVLFSPHTPHSYRAKNKVYADDWIFLGMEEGDEKIFSQLGIPTDEIVCLGNIDELSQTVKHIAFEHYSNEEGHELIEQHYFEILLIRLGRMIKNGSLGHDAVTDKHTRLMALRNMIYGVPDWVGDVDNLASFMNMSRSGFQHLYKKIFGVSVMEDIVESRIVRAKNLLRSTNLSVKEIGEKSGYTNAYSFMRQFKERVGMTPTQYRNCI
jgi:AraC family transcriptional regulator of arabinose operon